MQGRRKGLKIQKSRTHVFQQAMGVSIQPFEKKWGGSSRPSRPTSDDHGMACFVKINRDWCVRLLTGSITTVVIHDVDFVAV